MVNTYKYLFFIVLIFLIIVIVVQLQKGQSIGVLERAEFIGNQLLIHQGGKQIIRTLDDYKFKFDYYWYSYFSSKRRTSDLSKYVTPNHESIKEYTDFIKFKAKGENLEDFNLIEKIVEFIQRFDYIKDAKINFDDYPKYPIETIVEENGDCEDTSILLATLLESFGFDAILVKFSDHVGVGLNCDDCDGVNFEFNGNKYYYIETTGPNWEIGQLPENYIGQKAILIPV